MIIIHDAHYVIRRQDNQKFYKQPDSSFRFVKKIVFNKNFFL